MEVWKLIELILKSFEEHNRPSLPTSRRFFLHLHLNLRMIGVEVQCEKLQMVLFEYLCSQGRACLASKFRPTHLQEALSIPSLNFISRKLASGGTTSRLSRNVSKLFSSQPIVTLK